MKPVIQSLIVKRFRSIPTERVDFDNPTFLVGRNGSGKSNFVDVFAFLAEAMATPFQAVPNLDQREAGAAAGRGSPTPTKPQTAGIAFVMRFVMRAFRA
jgi:recombinational DNA repair ATPase RecF